MKTHWKNVRLGDVIQTNHGKGDLVVSGINTGPNGVTTITGFHLLGAAQVAGKKRVPNDGFIEATHLQGVGQYVPPSKPAKPRAAPKAKVRARGKSAAAQAIGK